jgi:hypothetical protein
VLSFSDLARPPADFDIRKRGNTYANISWLDAIFNPKLLSRRETNPLGFLGLLETVSTKQHIKR